MSNRSKHLVLGDTLRNKNSLGVLLTETWLAPEILDAELNIEGYTLFRGDRSARIIGGAAIYLVNELFCKLKA